MYAFTVGLTAAPLTHRTAGGPRKLLYIDRERPVRPPARPDATEPDEDDDGHD